MADGRYIMGFQQDMTFPYWMILLDAALQRECGKLSTELPAYPFESAYNHGLNPNDAALEILFDLKEPINGQ